MKCLQQKHHNELNEQTVNIQVKHKLFRIRFITESFYKSICCAGFQEALLIFEVKVHWHKHIIRVILGILVSEENYRTTPVLIILVITRYTTVPSVMYLSQLHYYQHE